MPAPSNRLSESVSSGARNSAGFGAIPRAGLNAANLENRSMIPPLECGGSAAAFTVSTVADQLSATSGFCLSVLCVRSFLPAQPPQNRQRRLLRLWSQIPCRTNAGRASRSARASLNQLLRLSHQQFMRAKQRFRKSNPSRIRVKEIQIRFEEFLRLRTNGLFHSHWRELLSFCPRSRRPLANRRSQVAPIAHQQQRGHRRQRIQQPKHSG